MTDEQKGALMRAHDNALADAEDAVHHAKEALRRVERARDRVKDARATVIAVINNT